ncbi:hypothetical protein P8917_01030 [Bacillus atrophaeus]|uniref:hypothetical protein n=1 Tax=Bacillus atrophaeus TaxID=1452 RepID=UPI00227F2E5C|nr:hypothetical protein [Bacillus atrophaeus]MCY8813656.1 hypothetical protein [Bacillus atrophaeus]MCY8820271.1 hypothetical protein [Bacillus atrophaeus]MCY8828605.1 hypothetical protein [Bacillus atrophaeus]MCY8832692.1 hypothetical protein [Bacillus atrophaeus]MEC0749774.1 hypothetical protein [Bacillus atrophaeus]
MIPAIVFEAKDKDKRFLCDGPDCGDWLDDRLDVGLEDITDALAIVRADRSIPDDKDVENFYRFISKLQFAPDVSDIKKYYKPVHIAFTEEQYNAIKERG